MEKNNKILHTIVDAKKSQVEMKKQQTCKNLPKKTTGKKQQQTGESL